MTEEKLEVHLKGMQQCPLATQSNIYQLISNHFSPFSIDRYSQNTLTYNGDFFKKMYKVFRCKATLKSRI